MKQTNIRWVKQDEIPRGDLKDLLMGAAWESIGIMLLVFASLSMCTVFSKTVRLGAVQTCLVAFSVIFTVLFYEVGVRMALQWLSRYEKYRALGKAGLILAIYWFFWLYAMRHAEELKGGLLAIVSDYVEIYNRIYKTNFSIVNAREECLSVTLCFIVLSLFFILYLLSGIGERKSLLILFPFLSAALLMYIGLAPTWEQFLMAITGAFMLYQGVGRVGGHDRGAIKSLALFLAVAVLSGVLFGKSAENLLGYAVPVKRFEANLEKNLKTAFSGFLSLENVKVDNSSPRYKDAEVFTVKLEGNPTGNLYFRNFCGEDYDGATWIFQDRRFENACKENGWSASKAAEYLAGSVYDHCSADLYWNAWTMLHQGQPRNVEITEFTIKYDGVLGRDMLLPYGADVKGIRNVTYTGDYLVKKSAANRVMSFQAFHSDVYDHNCMIYANPVVTYGRDEKEKEFWKWYDSYVKENYLSYPEYVDGVLRENNVHTDNATRIQLAKHIREKLTGGGYFYTWELDKLEPGADPVQYFLEEGHKGYCMHFASSGVLMLRKMGVPARYASGYVVKQSGFQMTEEGIYEAHVIDRNAHAWAEIYLDGIGWLPVEMTPGYESTSSLLPTDQKDAERSQESQGKPSLPQELSDEEESGNEEGSSEETPSAEEGDSQEEEGDNGENLQDETQEAPEKEKGLGFWGWGGKAGDGSGEDQVGTSFGFVVLGIVFFLLVVFALLWYRKQNAKKQMDGMLRRKFYRGAVRVLNRRVYRVLLLRRKINRGHMRGGALTDQDLEDALIGLLGEDRLEDVAVYMRIVKAAAFSRGSLSAKEYEFVRRIHSQVCRLR